MLLEIETAYVRSEIRWENTEGGAELFPHIYGPFPADAVISVQMLST